MIKKIFSFGLIAVLARFSGLIREIAVVFSYGTSKEADIFFIVTSIPLVFFMGYSLLYSNVFIKYYNDNSKVLLPGIIFIIILSLVVSTSIFLFSPLIIKIFAPGFDEQAIIKASNALKIASSYIILIGLVNICNSILNLWDKPNYVMFSNILNTLVVVTGIITSKFFGYYSIFCSLLFGYCVQFIYLLVYVFRFNKIKFNWSFKRADLKSLNPIIISSNWLFTGYFVQQLVGVVERAIATRLFIGAVSIMNYANKINGFIIGIVGLLISNLAYPYIIKKNVEEQREIFSTIFSKVSIIIISFNLIIVNVLNIFFWEILNDFNLKKEFLSVISVLLLLLCSSPYLILRELLNHFSVIFRIERVTTFISFINLSLYLVFLYIFNVDKAEIKNLALAIILSNIISITFLTILMNKKIGNKSDKKLIIDNCIISLFSISSAIGMVFNYNSIFLLIFSILFFVLKGRDFLKNVLCTSRNFWL
ncbi:MAG TPA: lipid II flippase MurJ [Metabacillus sp.]|nr:lipid II flippase MurJ [Metabacillus sp.]